MADHRYSPAPSSLRPDEIDVSTIPIPAEWLADRASTRWSSARLALTDTALDRLVKVLAGERVAGLPQHLNPNAMVRLLDAAWARDQPWRRLVEARLRLRGRSEPDVESHLRALQSRWEESWVRRHGDYMAWLTDGAITDEMVKRLDTLTDPERARQTRISANPARLDVEPIAECTFDAIQWHVRRESHPDSDLLEPVLSTVEKHAESLPPRPGAGDPDVDPTDVAISMVLAYLDRRSERWPTGRAGAWALGHVVDRFATTKRATAARTAGDITLAASEELRFAERTNASKTAWASRTEPWLCDSMTALLAAPSKSIPHHLIEKARVSSTSTLQSWVAAWRTQPKLPPELQVRAARNAVDRVRSEHAKQQRILERMRCHGDQIGPWWSPDAWRQRRRLGTRIGAQQQRVHTATEQVHRAEQRYEQLLRERQTALRHQEEWGRRTGSLAVAAGRELRLREQGLLEDLATDPPGYLVNTLGPPPSYRDDRVNWKEHALWLARAHAARLEVHGGAAFVAAITPPPTLSGTAEDQTAATQWVNAREAAGWPTDPAIRAYAKVAEPPAGFSTALAMSTDNTDRDSAPGWWRAGHSESDLQPPGLGLDDPAPLD